MTKIDFNFSEAYIQPSQKLVDDVSRLEGDVMILGAGGKIGPSIARLLQTAITLAGKSNRVIAVSRFGEAGLAENLNLYGIETISADILDDEQLHALPEIANILFLAGTKFGTKLNESYTWAMNTYLPGRVAVKFKRSRIVVYSTGNVYPYVSLASGGATEETKPEPKGEYGQSCLGRERIFEHFSSVYQTALCIYRLNYAVDFRYGVLLEIARNVLSGNPVDLTTGHVNLIWQSDANEMAIRSLLYCDTPAKVINVTGPETVSVRWLAQEFGRHFGKVPEFIGDEQTTALLSNAAEAFQIFGYPQVSLKQMIGITANWLDSGGETINKPTHFQEREGQY